MKSARQPFDKTDALNSANSNTGLKSMFAGTANPRHLRGIYALLASPRTRQALDAITGAANSPELVAELRRRGLDVPCTRMEVLDRDGQPCKPGVYSLTARDRHAIRQWLRGAAHDGR